MSNDRVDVCIHAEIDAGELLGMLDDPAIQGAWEGAERSISIGRKTCLGRQTLLALADDLAAYGTAGARLLCSGLLVDQEIKVVVRYSNLGLYLADRREQEGWVAFELAGPESCEGGS